MIINGNITIDVEKMTVTIRLDNGSYCLKHFTTGAKRFLDEEIDLLRSEALKANEGGQ